MEMKSIIDLLAEYNLQISLVGTVLSTVAAVFSASAAFSSANSARHAIASAAEAEKRFNVRSALSDAHAIIVECSRLKQLSSNLKLEYQSLAVFNGVSGGSREKLHQDAAYEKYERAIKLSTLASAFIKEPELPEKMDKNTVDARQIELTAARFEVEMLRDTMIDDLLKIRLQISEIRNKTVI